MEIIVAKEESVLFQCFFFSQNSRLRSASITKNTRGDLSFHNDKDLPSVIQFRNHSNDNIDMDMDMDMNERRSKVSYIPSYVSKNSQ